MSDEQEYGDYRQQEYEQRVWQVRCLMCSKKAELTQQEAERSGWELCTIGEFCPNDVRYAQAA